MDKSLSIFFPCYNDEGTIASMVISASITAKDLKIPDYEIIVVNDGSSDDSLQILENLQNKYPELKIVNHKKNKGYGGALISGFTNASKSLIFYTDGDAQYDVKELKLLYNKYLKTNADVVNGYKIDRKDPIHRIIIGKIYNNFVKFMFGIKIKDVDCDFRLMKKEIFNTVKLTQNSGVICVEMIKKIQDAKFKFSEVAVNHYSRTHGKSQFFNFKRIFDVGCGLIKLWLNLVIFP